MWLAMWTDRGVRTVCMASNIFASCSRTEAFLQGNKLVFRMSEVLASLVPSFV